MMLQLVLLQPLDEVRKVARAVSLSTVVDDIGLQRFGEEERSHADLTAAGCELARQLEKVDLLVAKDKTRFMSSVAPLR
eukprot:6350812-Pyramimonas_sp.AAC.1